MTQVSGDDVQHVGTFWMLNLNEETPLAHLLPLVPTNFQCSGPETALALSQAMDLETPEEVYRRFAGGRRCYVGKVEDTIAAYGWVTFDEECIGELGLSIHLQAGEAYIWDCATLPAYRGKRLYPALLAYIVSELRAEGLRRIWIGADAENVSSQTGMALVGFQPVVDFMLATSSQVPWLRGCPGVPAQFVLDVQRALFGENNHAIHLSE